MATAAGTSILESISDPVLQDAIHQAMASSMTMANVAVRCVSVGRIPTRESGRITGLIGVHGDVTGFITVNMPEETALRVVGALLMEDFDKLDHQVIDGVGEVTNMIAGGIKKGLMGSAWAFSDVTVPSVIVGQNYDIAYSQGLHFLSMTFEHINGKTLLIRDRLINVAVSLFRK